MKNVSKFGFEGQHFGFWFFRVKNVQFLDEKCVKIWF